jgi:hypothetical protein
MTRIDEEPDWLDEPEDSDEQSRRQLRAHQLSLMGLFALVTVCGVYFFLERTHRGQFGLHALAGVAVVVVLALPALWLAAWVARAIIDAEVSIMITLVVVAIVGAVLFCLTRFPGF